MIARWEVAGVHEHLFDCLVKTSEFHITGGDENAIFEDKVDRFCLEIITEEVGVCYDGIVRLDITGRHLDLFHLFVILNVDFEEVLEYALCFVTYIEQVDPDDIFLVKTTEDIDAAANFYFVLFIFVSIEYLEFCHNPCL